MRVEMIRTYESKLPPEDPHPYRTGAWTPNTVELDAYDLDVVAGEIPKDLSGVYLRNTENPLFDALSGRYHPFDGDGMIHAIRFEGGNASYRNRFVQTAGLREELAAKEPLWAGILESPELSKRAAERYKAQGGVAEVAVIEGDGGHLDGVFNVAKQGEAIRAFLAK